MKLIDYIQALFQFIWLPIVNAIMVVSGLVMVAVALPFRVKDFSVSDSRGIINLPKWAYPWGNDYDGMTGDKRGWWAEVCDSSCSFGLLPWLRQWFPSLPKVTSHGFWAMWNWAALRNPANNLRMFSWFQAPIKGSSITYVGDYTVEDDLEHTGCQFVKTENGGRCWYGFYLVLPYPNKTHAFVIRWGYKIKPSHTGSTDLPKGMVTKINVWKEL